MSLLLALSGRLLLCTLSKNPVLIAPAVALIGGGRRYRKCVGC
ncbi:hypothetical protein MHM_04610 [Candidatus Mycoplasma haemominutum 'Birmingham 1']|uniref:Uncharacterized protein n=1 Tax=Candidatus Mycoplasma haematominutum 'Birmingham 1' TaxID=1116213 RepID=G8C3T1_9MOLU|nr:hypothetical protein MHM_04610 [Candidatus Mycoplasma haematominutum 'Birmingham 1']